MINIGLFLFYNRFVELDLHELVKYFKSLTLASMVMIVCQSFCPWEVYPSIHLGWGCGEAGVWTRDVFADECVDREVCEQGGVCGRVGQEVWMAGCGQRGVDRRVYTTIPLRQLLKRAVRILLECSLVVAEYKYTYSVFSIKCSNLIF